MNIAELLTIFSHIDVDASHQHQRRMASRRVSKSSKDTTAQRNRTHSLRSVFFNGDLSVRSSQLQAQSTPKEQIDNAIDSMLTDMTLNGYVQSFHDSAVPTTLSDVRRHGMLPSIPECPDGEYKEIQITCLVPKIYHLAPAGLEVKKAGESSKPVDAKTAAKAARSRRSGAVYKDSNR